MTLIFGLAGVGATYFILKEVGLSRGVCLIGSLTLALNPIYFSLSYTFMTDVPFYTVFVLSAYFFLRSIRTDSRQAEALGALISWVAIGYR